MFASNHEQSLRASLWPLMAKIFFWRNWIPKIRKKVDKYQWMFRYKVDSVMTKSDRTCHVILSLWTRGFIFYLIWSCVYVCACVCARAWEHQCGYYVIIEINNLIVCNEILKPLKIIVSLLYIGDKKIERF